MKTKILVVLAAIALVFAFAFTACSNGSTGGGNQGDQTGTQGQLAFERITSGENAGTWRVRKGTFKGGALVIPAYYNDSTGRAARGIEDGDPVTEIGASEDDEWSAAFRDSGITSVEIPDTVKLIGGYAFGWNQDITSITIPASVTQIWFGSFVHCDNLKSITVAAGNPNYSSEGGILYTNIEDFYLTWDWNANQDFVGYKYTDNEEKTVLHSYPGASGSVTIKEGVTEIPFFAFAYNPNITSVTIPNSVTSIDHAFPGCLNLTSVKIGTDAAYIAENAFIECSSLKSITVDPGNQNFSGEGGILYSNIKDIEWIYNADGPYQYQYTYTDDNEKTVLYFYPSASGSVTIKDGVTCIASGAFAVNENITSVIIPSTVTEIGRGAFMSSTNIKSITIPDTVTKMGGEVFYNWTSSQTINIEGHANQAAADTAWNYLMGNGYMTNWRDGCNAKINYNGS